MLRRAGAHALAAQRLYCFPGLGHLFAELIVPMVLNELEFVAAGDRIRNDQAANRRRVFIGVCERDHPSVGVAEHIHWAKFERLSKRFDVRYIINKRVGRWLCCSIGLPRPVPIEIDHSEAVAKFIEPRMKVRVGESRAAGDEQQRLSAALLLDPEPGATDVDVCTRRVAIAVPLTESFKWRIAPPPMNPMPVMMPSTTRAIASGLSAVIPSAA